MSTTPELELQVLFFPGLGGAPPVVALTGSLRQAE